MSIPAGSREPAVRVLHRTRYISFGGVFMSFTSTHSTTNRTRHTHRRTRRSTMPRTNLDLLDTLEPRTLLSSIPMPIIPSGNFYITSYGASTSSSNNASAIQKTINAASAAGGGTVVIPSGTFLSGPLTLASNIDLYLSSGATLKAVAMSSYGSGSTNFITAKNVHDLEIAGSGTIDGQGAAWWSAYNANNSISRPRLINISGSNIIDIQNVKLQNSPSFNLAFGNTNNVRINTITISNPSTAPNTDGIDPAGAHYIIEGCTISTGDDDIAIKPGGTACSDIKIDGCTIGSGHGISVGGQTNDGLNGLIVENTTFNGTTNGLRLKAGRGFGGLVQNVTYSNITMTNVANPIYITSWYQNGGDRSPSDPSTATSSPVTSTTPIWQNIKFTGITVTGASNAGIIYGLPEEYINAVTFSNVHISAKTGMKVYYAKAVSFTGSSITVTSGAKLLTYDAAITGTV